MSNHRSLPGESPTSGTTTSSRPGESTLGRSLCEFESFEYDPDESVYQVVYDHDEVSPSAAVVNAIAAITDTNPRVIEPLYSVVDPDALDALATARYGPASDLEVTFTFHGYEVTAGGVGRLCFRRQDGLSSRSE